MFTKHGFTDISIVNRLNESSVKDSLASPEILSRLEKFANTVRNIAPKSDDFLYFTIIFLKAAEASLIDDFGNQKKVGHEKAWGYFDEQWRWKGNTKPHKNNNGDIFPEVELKKAARSWIGLPLCVDHKSDSVDGVRGIILDTYYDEKLKQIVGLCALDKINYPDLARKVETGVVRFGSMGTAVGTSICTECGKPATTPQEYCQHIIKREAWGEINVGLKPIEYSLVVQPAEPGARLLRCIASIKRHKNELDLCGINVDLLSNKLTESQADDLDILLSSVCGAEGCSVEQRQRIVKGFLRTGGFMKSASLESKAYDADLAEALSDFRGATGYTLKEAPELYERMFGDAIKNLLPEDQVTSEENSYNSTSLVPEGSGQVADYTGVGTSGITSSIREPTLDEELEASPFKSDGVGPESYAFASDNSNKPIKSITEDIMKEARRRKRAELRRRLAYPQGGADPAAEPDTYNDEGSHQESVREKDDKHMNQDKSMGGDSGMFPGDEAVKEKQLRAKDQETVVKKKAYHYGGADPAVEPATFKSEDYHKYWDMDKHMDQDKSMGGDSGMFPGDEKIKEHQKRASYDGPALKTLFKQKKNLNGTINKSASCLEVYAGDKLVIAATANDIYGKDLDKYWGFLITPEYGKRVVAEIREKGLHYVGTWLTKSAQDLVEEAPMEVPMEEVPMETTMEDKSGVEVEATDPKAQLNEALDTMESSLTNARDALSMLGGGEEVDINLNLGGKEGDLGSDTTEMNLMASNVLTQLKLVVADAVESADELALLSETHDGYKKLSNQQKTQLNSLTRDALNDSATIVGESTTLVAMAKLISNSMTKTSQYIEYIKEVPAVVTENADASKVTDANISEEIVANAMEIRKRRRADILKRAEEKLSNSAEDSEDEKDDEEVDVEIKADTVEVKQNKAHDGIGMKENAPVAGVTTDTAETVANKSPAGGDHKPAPSKGNPDAKQNSDYPSTPSKAVAEKANPAEDGAVDDKVEEESDDNTVKAKLTESFMNKKAEEEREAYKVKLRRAYDVGMEMQRKGLLAPTKPVLDRQVDELMDFDDKAFEALKRTIAMAQSVSTVKTASDVSGLNVGVVEDSSEPTQSSGSGKVDAKSLSDALWGE
jgi:hypothetical protein